MLENFVRYMREAQKRVDTSAAPTAPVEEDKQPKN